MKIHKTLTWSQYLSRWDSNWYRKRVRQVAVDFKSDGCTGVPNFYLDGCFEHDVAYRSGHDPLGQIITRREADKRLRWYIQMESPFGVFSLMSWIRWLVVRALGWKVWRSNESN